MAACEPDTVAHGTDWNAWWRSQERAGVVDFANWPYYIDRRRDNSHPSLQLFTRKTGVRVNYYRPIRDNATFLSKVRPALAAGEPIGYDLIVITNGPQLSELIRNGWLTPLDHDRIPNFFANTGPVVRNPVWDPNHRYTIAWQSGLTGIAYRPEAAAALGREPTSFGDLFEPALAGRVGMLRDLMDLGSAALLTLGVDPATSYWSQWTDAAALLVQQRDSGVLSKYYDQGYLPALQRGDIWLTQAWSGDIYQANRLGHRELRFVVPDEGALFWTDNMAIPRHAEHPADAMMLMDFVYRPKVAATIADWVWYICPVPEAERIIRDVLGDEEVANSPLVFPGEDLVGDTVEWEGINPQGEPVERTLLVGSRFRYYPVFDELVSQREWERIFGPIVTGGSGP
jgi:spermidine/putrescine transport system substrate-binding protein